MKEKLEKDITEHRQQILSAEQTIEKLGVWFDKYRAYEILVSKVELVISLLDDIYATWQQLKENREILEKCRKLSGQEQGRLKELQLEAERLQNLLPAEIVAWRLRLQEGQPCPVCGSLYHPFTASDEKQTLHEEELEKVRQEIAEQIALLQSQLERRQMEIARLDSLIGNYQKHEKQTKEKVQVYLGALTDWEALLEKGTLQQQIRKLADRWLKYTNEHIQQNERLGHLRVTVKLEENNLLDLQETLKPRKQSIKL